MAYFTYKAASPGGELLEGHMEAEDRETVIRRLQSQGQIPIRADEVSVDRKIGDSRPDTRRRRGRVGRRELGVITLELSTLLGAGLPLERALGILIDLTQTQSAYELLVRLRSAVRGGRDLSEAMSHEPSVFFPLYINLVRAGEAGGALDLALERLSEFMERARDLRESVISALIYPAILVVLAIGSIVLIMALVVPRFAQMFADAGAELPWATQVIVGLADITQQYWWLFLLGGTVSFLYARRMLRVPAVRMVVDKLLLRLPVWGAFTSMLEVARFSRALGTLLGNGVPLLSALGIARQIVGNVAIAAVLAATSDSVREGTGMARRLLDGNVFPVMACHMLQVGEETGQLDVMLLKLADIYDREVRSALSRMVMLLEPAIICGLGLMIAGIILSVVTAMLQINELAF
jgi:general secretion pathway protein F